MDKIDEKIGKLLAKRAECVRKIGRLKAKYGEEVINRKRRTNVIKKVLKESNKIDEKAEDLVKSGIESPDF